MENGLKDILRKKKKTQRKNIPTNIFGTNFTEIPDTIRIIYKEKVNLDQVNQIVEYRLKKLGETERLEKFSKDSRYYLEKYLETQELDALETYLDIAGRYIRIERMSNLPDIFLCKGCNISLESLKVDREGILICPECNCINTYLAPNSYTRDLERNVFYFDEDVNNFVKILDKFEGKTSLILGRDFFDMLDSYFVSSGFVTGEEVKTRELTYDGKREGTNRKMLWVALEKIGYSQYYDETSYIGHVYWGWTLPDITKYKDQILRDYQNTQNIWNTIKVDYKRTASLGTQFRLYVQLMAVEYPYCDRDDFKIQENVESLRMHNDAWKRMCSACNVKYQYVTC